MPREIALAIGVADAPPLPYLSGAVNGARAFHEWASRLGYESRLLTDEDDAVTIDRLRRELLALLEPAGSPIHRMLLYFAGHGIIRGAEEGIWLLSDWSKEMRGVGVEPLRRRLYRHDIQQIGIFADACRSLPTNMSEEELCADPVLGSGPIRQPKSPDIDRFIAAQDGAATFMVPGSTPDDDRCLFSGVLMEGLWGTRPDAFSKIMQGKVTSSSLGRYLKTEVPKRANCYECKLDPVVSPAFPEDDNTYFWAGVPALPPKFPDWPAPGALASMGTRELATNLAARQKTVRNARQKLADRLRAQHRPSHFETGAGFAIEGGSVRIWTPAGVFAEPHGSPDWWRLSEGTGGVLGRSAPALIEFSDGLFAAVTALPQFVASVLRKADSIAAVVYRPVWAPPDIAQSAEEAIAAMEGEALRSDAATDLATKLRQGKHSDPVLGVISAYLYDSIGDIDSISQTAFYYVQHQQPIPYDIALLAQLECTEQSGSLRAHVPAVPERAPRTDAEVRHAWTYVATPESSGEVAGRWPWMRQGWAFLDDSPEQSSALIPPGLAELNTRLKPGRFPTLDASGARELAALFDLAIRP